MRLFIAIELSDVLRAHLIQMQEALRPLAPAVSCTKSQNLHLTLKFLGDVPEDQVPALNTALAQIRVAEFTLTPAGLVGFPPRGQIRIIAAAMDEPSGALHELQRQIEDAAQACSIPRENRSYHPHVTLARARVPLPSSIRPTLVEAIALSGSPPSQTTRAFALVQSQLSPTGPTYTVVSYFG